MMVIHINYFSAKVPFNFWTLLFLRKMDIRYATHQHRVALQPSIKFRCWGPVEITLLFVIAIKYFMFWLKMRNSIGGNWLLPLAMTLNSPGRQNLLKPRWFGIWGKATMGRCEYFSGWSPSLAYLRPWADSLWHPWDGMVETYGSVRSS